MALALITGANAQVQKRLWTDGPLKWADFKVLPTDSASTSWLQYSFEVLPLDTLQGMIVSRDKLVCYMDPQQSWVMDDYMTDRELHYNQVLFNLAEIQCRMFQPSLDMGYSPLEIDSLLIVVAGYCQVEEDRFVYESNVGQDSAVVARWLDSTNRLLAEMPSAAQARVADAPGWGLGAHIGMGYSWLGKGIDATFKNAYSFQMGVELLNRRHSFMWDMIIGGGGSKRSFIFEDGGDTLYYPVGHRYTWFQMDFDYGYYVVHKDKFAMMPFVGFGFSSISATYGYGDEAPMYGDACFSWFAGVACDWIMRNRVSGLFFDGTREREETGLRVMLYAARSALCGYNTVSANLAVSLNFESRSAKLKY